MLFIPDHMEKDIRALINSEGGAGDESKGIDYVYYESMFTDDFLIDLTDDMMWLEKHYANEFMDTKVKRASGNVEDGDYKNYHRVSKTLWLSFVK